MMMEKLVEWWLVWKTEVPGENLPQRRFVHYEPHMLCPDANPGRRGGKPATNRLSYGTAGYSLLLLSLPILRCFTLISGWTEFHKICFFIFPFSILYNFFKSFSSVCKLLFPNIEILYCTWLKGFLYSADLWYTLVFILQDAFLWRPLV
jgi:hypothetical protein